MTYINGIILCFRFSAWVRWSTAIQEESETAKMKVKKKQKQKEQQ